MTQVRKKLVTTCYTCDDIQHNHLFVHLAFVIENSKKKNPAMTQKGSSRALSLAATINFGQEWYRSRIPTLCGVPKYKFEHILQLLPYVI